jgi:hypothetical protein
MSGFYAYVEPIADSAVKEYKGRSALLCQISDIDPIAHRAESKFPYNRFSLYYLWEGFVFSDERKHYWLSLDDIADLTIQRKGRAFEQEKKEGSIRLRIQASDYVEEYDREYLEILVEADNNGYLAEYKTGLVAHLFGASMWIDYLDILTAFAKAIRNQRERELENGATLPDPDAEFFEEINRETCLG